MQRMIHIATIVTILTVCALSGPTNIDPLHKFAWSENAGWLNWRDANGGADGVYVQPTFLFGYIWAENVGWINAGDGAPANGINYANVDDTDFGVNIDPPTGDLFGYAWGENIGWVNFDTRGTLSGWGQQAEFDFAAGRFRGYAWGENVGWINLDHATYYVAYVPPNCNDPFADTDGDSDADQDDLGAFQICISGSANPATPGCECFDRPEPGFPQGDNDVDPDDLDAFEACASGPEVLVDADCDD